MRLIHYSLKATEARKNYSRALEDTVRNRSQVIRKLSDTVYWISADHLDTMLAPCRLTLRAKQDSDGTYYGLFDELDVMATGSSFEDLKQNLAVALCEYAASYIEDFQPYYNSPNRQQHLPYVWRS